MAGGVLPVLKHLPGYGLGVVDSHEDLPRVAEAPLEDLAGGRFRRLPPAGRPALGDDRAYRLRGGRSRLAPATLSPVMIRLIREEMGFAGC
jgi:beta-N-acetylhexosaminidase